ncbi:transporter [Desulfoprunum benzoelyticum]|uniref:Long-chain fatty acid transport protein n=1 Tax=Desulfoprunum benzoelyticum TaxID=1506996 RepID=A0A840UUJ9_9BACT|nr:OmpP1/FadL family transporter [Desulfoprunum benzoelyticum]MBB5347074.1 long-chain fatty acid transport protein [Desulfoprunum benzoelyticum]MBM9529768.1 transporter [Desulfoprunum benzoelyticum]
MKKTISALALVSLFTATAALASGYRIPEQSVDSSAKAGANVASASRADAAYYNPANMSWLSDGWQAQANLTYIHLTPISYEDYRSPYFDSESEDENFLLPTGFLVSPFYGNFRFGLSITAPYGLAKRWNDPYPRATAEEFSLTVIDFNPTVSYRINDMVSISGGPRLLYSEARVETDARYVGTPAAMTVDGDTTEWGYNLAVAVKPSEDLNFSATYRSNVDLDFEGDVDLFLGRTLPTRDGEVSIPAPAVLTIAAAFKPAEALTVELSWDRTFWSEYEELDFDFFPAVGSPFETPKTKDWDDSSAYRIGLSYQLDETWTLMGGIAYDETPVPKETLGFELPDSDAWLFSVGTQYKVNEKMDVGMALLYDYKEKREVTVTPLGTAYGEFTDASAILMTVGLNYKF